MADDEGIIDSSPIANAADAAADWRIDCINWLLVLPADEEPENIECEPPPDWYKSASATVVEGGTLYELKNEKLLFFQPFTFFNI